MATPTPVAVDAVFQSGISTLVGMGIWDTVAVLLLLALGGALVSQFGKTFVR